ncbi:MAG: formate/nitrite transporter family protein [Vulcanimicrobiaceae bacterium]
MPEPTPTSGSTVDLSATEERDVEDRTPPRAAVVFETVRREGEIELDRPILSLAASGVAAGLSMGMSLVGEGLIESMLPNAIWRPLLVSFGYTVGFVIVVLGRQQLFTENTVTAILPLLDSKRKLQTLGRVARLWAIVLAANLTGGTLFAYAIARSTIFGAVVKATFLEIGTLAAAPSFWEIVVRGIFAGWLIALMVWLLPGADRSRLWVVIFVTYFVGLGSFAHIIAGSIAVLYLVASGHETWGAYLARYLLPVFIGNAVGGVSLVALLNYAQVVAEGDSNGGDRSPTPGA